METPYINARSWILSFGIGTSEVEHVLATQTLGKMPKNMRIIINGNFKNVTSKDIILKVISEIGTAAGTDMLSNFLVQLY